MKIKKKRVKTRIKTAASIGNGWLTTDEEEIERRRLRSMEEKLTVKRINTQALKNETIYGDYLVSSESSQYLVEYRDKQQRINACSCPDYQVNGWRPVNMLNGFHALSFVKKYQSKECVQKFLLIEEESMGTISLLLKFSGRTNCVLTARLENY